MKKTLSVLMALVLALSMCAMTMVTAFAADSASLTVKSNVAQAKVGDVITVSVDLSANSAIATIRFLLQYDSASVEPVGLPAYNPDPDQNPQLSFGIVKGFFDNVVANWHEASGLSYTAFNGMGVTNAGGTIFKAQFKVLKTNPTFTLKLDYATDSKDGNLPVSVNSVTIACAHANTSSNVTAEPSCDAAGQKTVVCNDCGETLRTESIPATGHSFGAWAVVKEATCTEEGVEERVCANCGEKETRSIAKAAHTPGEWEVTKEPTCTEEGEKVQKCSACGEVLSTEVVPALGHTVAEDAWTVTKEPNCTEDGEREGVCEVCGEKVVEVIPALGHTVAEDAWTVTKEPTCTEDGEKEGICEVCGEKAVEAIPALGHDFGEWVVVKEATETEEGLKERVCAVCGEKETEVIPKLTAEGEGATGDTNAPSIPKTSGAVIGSVASLAMLSMAAGVAAVTMKKRKEDK